LKAESAPVAECDTSLPACWRDTPNFQSRRDGRTPTILLLHYTGMESADAALDHLCSSKSNVSCHYLIDEQGRVTQMVPEAERAWHAGQSHWAGEDDVNSASIGIEIVNKGHDLGYEDFPDEQIDAVIALSKDIIERHGISPRYVLGHSDVAPRRKKDPGEKFPWRKLHAAGIGHWVEPEPLGGDEGLGLRDTGEAVQHGQQLLADYGYLVGVNGKYGKETATVVSAFQRHFRPDKVDGRLDRSTLQTLEKLLAALPE
jgi:N-acetylmuramoyl-L-alanine amidase